jgi:alanyl-tRNA synthetase
MLVETTWMPRGEAESRYGFRLYQGGAVPGKEIRVVKTGDWDLEACGGTHLKRTREIGFVKIVYTERVQDGVERIAYAVGLQALKKVQEQERLIWRLSDTLSAPTDKLDKTAERIVKELKEANAEKRKLLKELAQKESTSFEQTKLSETAEELDGISIVKRNFGSSPDINRMVQTSNELINRNEAAVAVFYGVDDKTVKIIVNAGREAVKKGVNANEAAGAVSKIIGGGGGGRSNFAQAGGTHPEKISEAVQTAMECIKKQISKHQR